MIQAGGRGGPGPPISGSAQSTPAVFLDRPRHRGRGLLQRLAVRVRIIPAPAPSGQRDTGDPGPPAVVLVDISMPPPDGIQLARLLGQDAPGVKTITVTMHESGEMVEDALAAGAPGFVLKRSGPDELLSAIRGVVAGERYVDAWLRQRGITFAAA